MSTSAKVIELISPFTERITHCRSAAGGCGP